MELPQVPVGVSDFIPYLSKHSDIPITKSLEPFKAYEAKLREVFAQEPTNKVLEDHHINTVPIFAGHEAELKVQARQLDDETKEGKERYLLSLPTDDRKANGSSAIVDSIKDFKTNFNLFSESALVDMDWSNVVAGGSSVVTALLPVPEEYKSSKRALREYYHEKLAPASDVDLFIYGLNEEEAVQKMQQVETSIRDSILHETTTIRTKNAITIASQYPTRHVQIVLRLYKSVSEILTGFDVDCSCVAFDGSQVWATPRAIAAYMTQINAIDLSRRSSSYENRLSKYSHRGFEVYWPSLERSRIDPTIFERSFSRVMGLARLLVLEKLPKPDDRDNYLAKRRAERGRPALPWNNRWRYQLPGNVKDQQPDDVAEWVEEDEVSNYHTFTIPDGPKYNAKKIEKLLYTKDLLLNTEWNRPKDREVNLHRHPAFFGSVNDVVKDCCGYCPTPVTDEELEAAEEEEKIYIAGNIEFIQDDPGRQAIGSFNPITDDDWTEMAYVGNTARLCQAIVDGDLEHVQDWCDRKGVDVNRRDYTGRTPLHLATMCSTADIVRCLIDHVARLVARMVDGFTALHIAARRGNVEMVTALLEKSEANEEEEAIKEDQRRAVRKEAAEKKARSQDNKVDNQVEDDEDEEDEEEGEGELMEDDDDSDESNTVTEGSFVKVKGKEEKGDTMPDDENGDEPDVYDVNVLAWDSPVSPLHLAILGGHIKTAEVLVTTFGADVLLPVKLVDSYSKNPRGAILTLILALQLPLGESTCVTKALLGLGASSAQADMNQVSALHYVVHGGASEVLDTLFEFDEPAAKTAINHLSIDGWQHSPQVETPLLTAIRAGKIEIIEKLLTLGADISIGFESFMRSYQRKFERSTSQDPKENMKIFERSVEQPVMVAAQSRARAESATNLAWQGETLLDVLDQKLKKLKAYTGEDNLEEPRKLERDEHYLDGLTKGTYKYWLSKGDLSQAKSTYNGLLKDYEKSIEESKFEIGNEEKKAAIQALIKEFEGLLEYLKSKAAKHFSHLHPNIHSKDNGQQHHYHSPVLTPFELKYNFLVSDLTEAKRERYFQLFEAAWDGDLQTIKTLTLSPWGPESANPPLKIAVKDMRGFSPFSIAVFRSHLNLAKSIVEIAEAQYHPEENDEKQRYNLRPRYDSDDESEISENNDDVRVYGELADDRFTVDDIGAAATSVKSKVKPVDLIQWDSQVWRFIEKDEASAKKATGLGKSQSTPYFWGKKSGWSYFNHVFDYQNQLYHGSLIRYATAKADNQLVTFLLDLGVEYQARNGDEDASKVFTILGEDFGFAVSLGRTEIIAEIIKKTGAGIPLQALVEKSGMEVPEKPKHYRGLSVYGRKRKDWIDAGRGTMHRPIENEHPPLLEAAFKGNLDSTEWFLSEAPLRRYKEFAMAYKEDKRLQTLGQAKGGFDKALSKWLNSHNDLALACAVMAKPRKNSIEHIEYLLNAIPCVLDSKNQDGLTPLLLALSLRRISAARVLIKAGADQTQPDRAGINMLHYILRTRDGAAINSTWLLEEMIPLVDQSLLKSMFAERCSHDPGSLTPLARWLHGGVGDVEKPVLEIILSYSKGKDLEIMDGAGDYPLHVAVKKRCFELAKCIIDFNPALLYRENATGLTPLDMTNNAYLRHHMDNPPSISRHNHHRAIEYRPSYQFVGKWKGEIDTTVKTRQVLNEAATTHLGKRKLVSLFDANEVAKCLAARPHSESGPVHERQDEVGEWYDMARQFENLEEDQEPPRKKAMVTPESSQEV